MMNIMTVSPPLQPKFSMVRFSENIFRKSIKSILVQKAGSSGFLVTKQPVTFDTTTETKSGNII